MDMLTAGMLFILAFLGLVLVVFLIFFLWLAHEYNIVFSITAKRDNQEGSNQEEDPEDPGAAPDPELRG